MGIRFWIWKVSCIKSALRGGFMGTKTKIRHIRKNSEAHFEVAN